MRECGSAGVRECGNVSHADPQSLVPSVPQSLNPSIPSHEVIGRGNPVAFRVRHLDDGSLERPAANSSSSAIFIERS